MEALERKAGLCERKLEGERLDLEKREVMRHPPQRKIGVGAPTSGRHVQV